MAQPPAQGLSEAEAAHRLTNEGPNSLPEAPPRTLWQSVAKQALDPLTLILLLAGLASLFLLRETFEGAAILAIVLLNAALSVWQEQRAENALQELKDLAAPSARVRRGGQTRTIPAREVVRGDFLDLEAGDRIAADAHLIEADALEADESALTGESLPVEKIVDGAWGESTTLADRKGGVHAATLVVRGRGLAVVTATGKETAIGKVASGLGTSPPPPLEVELRSLARRLAVVAVLAGALMVGLVFVRPSVTPPSWGEVLLTGVALAVAALPEGLVAVVTLTLALGVQRMARQGAIMRNLRALDALGRASILCVDKTGTLTEGRLGVERTWQTPEASQQDLWLAAARCNDARDGLGDALDVALMATARQQGTVDLGERVASIPFDPLLQTMTTLHRTKGAEVVSLKGAPEKVAVRVAGASREGLLSAAEAMAKEGLRVIALADSQGPNLKAMDMRLLGLVGLRDVMRATAPAAVADCRAAGIRVVMVTGDHPDTAARIAAQAGLVEGNVVTGRQLALLAPEPRNALLRSANVVARVEPSTKVDLVEAHRASGAVVAMMGDGVNDAPALEKADVGVAVLGGSGTDVARAASDVVLTKQDLGTLVDAIRQGRRIRRNIESVITYLLSGNLCEVLVVLGGLVLFPELPVTLTAAQLLWCNLVTDGPAALAVGVDTPAYDPLRVKPSAQALLGWKRLGGIGARGFVMACAVFATAWLLRAQGASPAQLQSEMFLSLLSVHTFLALHARSRRWSFEAGWWRNVTLVITVAVSFLAQFVIVLLPWTRALLGLAPIPLLGLVLSLLASVGSVLIIDAGRIVLRRRATP